MSFLLLSPPMQALATRQEMLDRQTQALDKSLQDLDRLCTYERPSPAIIRSTRDIIAGLPEALTSLQVST
jgi:hypothetical protein